MILCPICHPNIAWRSDLKVATVNCGRCGAYQVVSEALPFLARLEPRNRSNVSGLIRERQGMVIGVEEANGFQDIKTPSVGEMADKLLLELERRSTHAGAEIKFNASATTPEFGQIREKLMGASWALNEQELWYLLRVYLDSEKQLIQCNDHWLSIRPNGYDYLHKLRQDKSSSQIGFCAMWFECAMKPLWTKGIEPTIRGAGYEPKRIDEHHHNNRIDDEIIAMIRRSRFVVADFTGQRGGVYFEAGFALGLGLPVIWLCRKDELSKVHFDNRQYNFIAWENNDIEGLKWMLQNRIEATLGKGSYGIS